jgi:hypothetical protein
MCINLKDGHLDAYNFKLTSKNILLDSNPEEGGYYLYIGPMGDDSKAHISFSEDGKFVMKVDEFDLTGTGTFGENTEAALGQYLEDEEYIDKT